MGEQKDPEIHNLISYTERNTARAQKLVASLNNDQINWKPSKEAWSVAECLSHLNNTFDCYDAGIRAMIVDAKYLHLRKKKNYCSSISGYMLRMVVSPKAKTKIKTPHEFLPTVSSVNTKVVEEFFDKQEHLSEFEESFDGFDLNRAGMKSPVSSMIQLSCGDVFHVLNEHCERHLNQIERLLSHDQFPHPKTSD